MDFFLGVQLHFTIDQLFAYFGDTVWRFWGGLCIIFWGVERFIRIGG